MPSFDVSRLALWAGIGAMWVAGRAALRHSGAVLLPVTIPLAGLPAERPGISVLLLSDLHVGSPRSPALHVLEELKGLAPDLLCLAGDLVDAGEWMPEVTRRLAAIQPRHGAFAVWGNHELFRFSGRREPGWLRFPAQPLRFMAGALHTAGVQLLVNDSRKVSVDGLELQIVGLGDATSRAHDVGRAFRSVDDRLPTLVLSHNPDAAFELDSRRADLVMCGHTHGGQIVPPLGQALYTGTRRRLPRSHGLMHIEGRPVYISRGIGTVLIPLRVNAAPEATLLRLIPPGD